MEVLKHNPSIEFATERLNGQMELLRGQHEIAEVVQANLQQTIPLLTIAVAFLLLVTIFLTYRLVGQKDRSSGPVI